MSNLNETPSSNRIHIGIFGKTNSGKSTLANSLTRQSISTVSDIPGTTTDVVTRAMEINGLGPCVIIDTPGLDDNSELGKKRVDNTKKAMAKVDIAVVVIRGENTYSDFGAAVSDDTDGEMLCSKVLESMPGDILEATLGKDWFHDLKKKNIPVIVAINCDDYETARLEDKYKEKLEDKIKDKVTDKDLKVVFVNATSYEGVKPLIDELGKAKIDDEEAFITRDLVHDGDVVMLVMPQDIQAPKGRLILPQVQTIRELLDRKCTVISTTTQQLISSLDSLKNPPKLIITDSQVFAYVHDNKPTESLLTSFSVLFAAYKGDIDYYLEGAKKIDSLDENSKVLIAECCTHAPLNEDIGREKIPRMLRKRFGDNIKIDYVNGVDFGDNISSYDLVIHCGGCMFNRSHIMSRIAIAKDKNVAMTNYGIFIAHMTGILDKIVV